MINAMIIEEIDGVAVAIEEIKNKTEANFKINGRIETIKVIEDIPIYHKFAVKNLSLGEPVLRYGVSIGIATKNIKRGEHVHVHNLESETK